MIPGPSGLHTVLIMWSCLQSLVGTTAHVQSEVDVQLRNLHNLYY